MLPKRRTKPRSKRPGECLAHLQWVRGFRCCGCGTDQGIQAHHVKVGIAYDDRGGMGRKGHDKMAVPLCLHCHTAVHASQDAFERKHGVDLNKIAAELWAASPAGRRYRMEHDD